MNDNQTIFDSLQAEIMGSTLPEDEKNHRLTALDKISRRQINIMLVGASGAGKSSTINALFDMSVAKVGMGVDPETKEIARFDLDNMTIWDTPGLGDGVAADKLHTEQIVKKLSEVDSDGNLLIDLVLVVLDAGSKDLAVSYNIINNTLIPSLGQMNTNRILVGLNQADLAMKGRHWNHILNQPEEKLVSFLEEKANSVQRRIHEATGVHIEPVWYCAGYMGEDGAQRHYNLSKLLYYILMAVPAEKRLLLVDKLNASESNWNSNDADYTEAVKHSFFEGLLKDILAGLEKGAIAGGCVIGVPGMLAGGLIGAVTGGLHALIIKPMKKLRSLKKLGLLVKGLVF